MSEHTPPDSDAAARPDGTALGAPPTGRRGLVRLVPLLGAGNLAVYAFYIGISGVLLPLHIQGLHPGDEEAAVANLGIVTGVAAVFGTLFNPIGGALSDRTRTRWGRRNPWMVGGALAALLAAVVLGLADSVLMVLLGWCLAQATMNLCHAALTGILPDRVPDHRRGTVASVMGMALSVAGVLGTGLAALFTERIELGYIALGGVAVAAVVLLCAFTHDPRGDELPPPPPPPAERVAPLVALGRFLSALTHRNFALVLIGRALLFLGYFLIIGYQLYIFDYYIELPDSISPAAAVPIVTALGAVGTVVTAAIGGPLSDRLDRRKLFTLVSGVASALAMLIPYYAPTWTGMIVFGLALGGAFGCFLAVDTALATLVLPNHENYARDMGLLNIAAAGPQIMAPFIASMIILHVGGYSSLFLVGAGVGLLGALSIAFVKGVR
ncbi:MFS transporter [Nocardiopsis sp. HNM0947]|uniref:MFS transporter n=1 Tax=Nocardiopsis coralli TaxID=2772213 RepID=A0ABR9P6W2_9ACTN|nr:MFS transporter [Nocardiopsis coralli]MBE2999435.1 MFS transporter [Nocardiopsis coralli]